MGDAVWGLDGRPAMVERVHVLNSDHIRDLRYRVVSGAGEPLNQKQEDLRRLETTDEHLFWVPERGWVAAHHLQLGDWIRLAGGAAAEITENRRLEDAQKVYNFDVKGENAYFANDALVHQRCGADLVATEPAPSGPDLRKVSPKLRDIDSYSARTQHWASVPDSAAKARSSELGAQPSREGM